MNRMFFFGFGYTAAHLARRLKNEGWEMAGTTRTNDKVNAMWDLGVEPHIWDGENPLEAPLRILEGATHVLHSIPPHQAGDRVLIHHQKLLSKIAGDIKWLGYISTTSVYGDTKGDWCGEDYAPNPSLQRGKLRLRVETNLRKLAKRTKLPLHIFRSGAIYGPRRNALGGIINGKAEILRKPGHYISRIHVADLANTIYASMNKPNPISVYNVVDDHPSGMDEPVEYAVEVMGLPQPPIVDVDEEASNVPANFRAAFRENRRIENDLIKSELGVELLYPSFKEGYREFIEKAQARKAKKDAAAKAD